MPGPKLTYQDTNLPFNKKLESVPKKYLDPEGPVSQMGLTGRFPVLYAGVDNEDIYARRQSAMDQLANGILKMTGTFATSFVSGTVGAVKGMSDMMATGKFSSFYDNDFNRALDEWNKELEDILPNYYSQAEKDADWYSPTNILSANFLGDKVLKNLGYSFGALAGGMGWGALFKSIGLTNKLVRAGQGLKTVEAVEGAIANTPRLQQFGQVNKALNSLWNSSKSAAGIAMTNTERGIISTMGMLGEASIEGLQNLNEFRNNLIQQYKDTYGTYPTGEVLDEINNYAENVGNTTFAANAVLLTLTNFMQLPKILGSSKTLEKRAINNIIKEGDEIGGKFVADAAQTGNILSPVVGKLGAPGRFIDKYVLGPGRLAFSAGEAFEEGMQYSIQKGSDEYFNRAYTNPEEVKGLLDGVGGILGTIFTEGIAKTLTEKEGLESILIGGVSGAIQKVRGNIKERGITGEGGYIGANTQLAVDALNKTNLKQVLKDGVKYAGIAIESQKLRQQAIQNNDTKSEKDYEKDYALAYILPRVKYGKVEGINQELGYYREQAMTDSGFQELQDQQIVLPGETKERFLQRLSNIKSLANQVNSLYEQISDKYSGITDKEGKPLYTSDVIDRMVYDASKIADYDTRLSELQAKLLSKGVNTSMLSQEIAKSKAFSEGKFEDVLLEEDVKKEFEAITAKALDEDKLNGDETVKELGDFAEMIFSRQSFTNDYSTLKSSPEKFKPVETAPVEVPEEQKGKKIRVTNALKEEMDLEVGKKYYAGERINVKEKDGKISRVTSFTVVGESEDGSVVRVLDKDGRILDVKKEAFKKYTIGEVDDPNRSDNATFYIETSDHIFTYNLGKGKKIEGSIFYDKNNDRLIFQSLDGKFRRYVTRDQFSPKEGYTVPQIYSKNKFTKLAEQALVSQVPVSEKLATRNKIIVDLYESSKKELEEVTKKLEEKKEQLSKKQKEIEEAFLTKKGKPRKNVDAVRKVVTELTKQKELIEKEITTLEENKSELEQTLPYLQDILQNSQELPESGKEMLNQMREDVAAVKELISITESAINDAKSLSEAINSAIETAMSLLNDFVKRLSEENPNAPLYMDVYIQRLEKYLGEEGAKQVIADKAGFTELILDLQDQISGFEQELNIPDMKSKVGKLNAQLAELEQGFKDLSVELKAKESVLSAFDTYAKREAEKKAAEEKMKKDKTLVKEFFGTHSTDVQTTDEAKVYEPASKKDMLAVVMGTMAPSGEHAKKPFNQRANRFGFRFHSLENRDDIKGIIVTANTEDQLIPGLIYSNREKKELGLLTEGMDTKVYSPDNVIALVMVKDNGDGTFTPVDEFGEPISSKEEYLEKAIFQVFPTEKLTAKYGDKIETMFRKGTPENVEKSLREQYAAWRKEELARTSLPQAEDISASFGIPQINDYNTPVSAEAAGLVTDETLTSGRVVKIATTNESVGNGSVVFNTPLGRVFLEVPGGLVKLFNRKLNKKEANVVFDVIHHLSKTALMNGSIKDEKSKLLVDWLKSVIYWGIAKNFQTGERKPGGYNNVWFEEVFDEETGESFPKLFISGKGEGYQFTPSELMANKEEIINLLSNIYNNANATLLNDKAYNQPYFEITGIDVDGNLQTKEWPNYQSFLLSPKGRTAEEIPFTTRFNPITEENPVNREGIYFTISENTDRYKLPEAPKIKTSTPEKQEPSTAPTYVLDGTTENTMQIGTVGEVKFKLDAKKSRETDGKQGLVVIYNEEVVKAVAQKKNISEEQAQQNIANYIYSVLEKQINEDAISSEQPSTGVYVLDGVTENTMEIGTNGSVKFTLDAKLFLETGGQKGLVVRIPVQMAKDVAQKRGVSEEQAQQNIANYIISILDPQIQSYAIPQQPPVPTPVASPVASPVTSDPVSNKKADIERRRQEELFVTTTKNINDFTEQVYLSNEEGRKELVNIIKYLAEGNSKKSTAKLFNLSESNVQKIRNYFSIPSRTTRSVGGKQVGTVEEVEEAEKEFKQWKDKIDEINAKYDAELAALEGAKPAEEQPPAAPTSFRNRKRSNIDDKAYRMQLVKEMEQFRGENWEKVEKWLKENFPNVPVYRVKNVIRATNGRQAWGFFQNGAIYVYENAEVGTVYHEVFEAVWSMFTDPQERQDIIDEFRNRPGSYTDRFTGETIKYSEATPDQLKEELAEEFRDFVLYGKVPVKPKDGRPLIVRLFNDLVNFIKTFFTGNKASSNTEKLFSRIGNGYYKQYVPYERALSFAQTGVIDIDDVVPSDGAEFRFRYIPATQAHEIVEHMTYLTLTKLSRTNDSLFKVTKLPKKQLYAELKKEVLEAIGQEGDLVEQALAKGEVTKEAAEDKYNKLEYLWNSVDAEWDLLTKKHEEYLKVHSVEFDENDNAQLTDENKIKESDFVDARKVDGIKKANPAIKLLLATIPKTVAKTTIEDGVTVKDYVRKRSSVGGAILLPRDRVIATLYNRLHNATDIDDMLSKLRDLAQQDPDYRALYLRLTKNSVSEEFPDLSVLSNEYDWQLLAAFWTTFSKMNADVKTVFILPDGTVQFADTSLAAAAKQEKEDMFNTIVNELKTGKKYVSYNSSEKSYSATSAVKNVKLSAAKISTYVDFLKNIGIEFSEQEYKALKTDNKKNTFREAVEGILLSVSQLKDVKSINKQSLSIEGNLLKLGALKANLKNPDFETTYFNVNGERVQTFIGQSAVSRLHNVISKIKKLGDLADTSYKYLLTDNFTKGSVVLSRLFNEKGSKIANTETILSPGYIDGIVNESDGKKKEASKVNYRQRLVQEINANINGYYMNLVPGDASMEHMVKLHEERYPFVSRETLLYSWDNLYKIFEGYFISEANVSLDDDRKIVQEKGRKSTDLRFFKPILDAYDEGLHDKIVKQLSEKSPEEVYANNKSAIDSAVKEFVEQEAADTFSLLETYGIVSYTEEGMSVSDLAITTEDQTITKEFLMSHLNAISANYIVANIELHKLIYSDPYLYSDELKRIKNFNSPAKPLLTGKRIGDTLNKVFNKLYSQENVGWTDMEKGYMRSTVVKDVFSTNLLDGYSQWKETDGGGYITDKANRKFRLRAGDWTDDNERQFKYDIAWMKNEVLKSDKSEEIKKRFKLSKEEVEILKNGNPRVKSTYTPLKPIVRGSKDDGNTFNDVVLDKFALFPLSYRLISELAPESNMIDFYMKMIDEDVDYAVFESGRKVGGGESTSLYNEKGKINTAPFAEVNNIPFEIMYVQTEVPSKDKNDVTRGSQITKLVTLDYMEGGVPIDFDAENEDFEDKFDKWMMLSEDEKVEKSPLYKEIKRNQDLLEEMIDEGFQTLLKKLGLKKVSGGFEIADRDKMLKTLSEEIMKREVNDNISAAFEDFRKGDVVLEATPAYQQIRNILFSIADKNVISPKISGGMKVQVPSSLLETDRIKVSEFVDKKGETRQVYSSDDELAFYVDEDGKRVCEIMVGRWFKSDMTDEELLNYFNNTEEGKKELEALFGVGFRIPTQKQNSIDAFRIKKFLPYEYGDSVIIPSALVNKAGSDFDIDKLSVYLKNLFKDADGNLRVVKRVGNKEQTKQYYRDIFNKLLSKNKTLKETSIVQLIKDIDIIDSILISDSEDYEQRVLAKNKKLDELISKFDDVFEDAAQFLLEKVDELKKGVLELNDEKLQNELREAFAEKKYKQVLENEYIESTFNLVTNPLNFKNLVKPNSADPMKDLAKEIIKATGQKEFDYTDVKNMLNRGFMSSLRQAFVTGKYAIGIAAVNQTNHAQSQRSPIFIDRNKLMASGDKDILGDGIINLPHNTIKIGGTTSATISKIESQNGEVISDTIGQFIDGYVDISKGPWIMQLGATPNVASTWLFLVKVGVPVRHVAYFMNQPIIRDYLRQLENQGYSWLFNDKVISFVSDSYDSGGTEYSGAIDLSSLEKMIGKKSSEMTPDERAQQRYIMKEFLKYAKMAEHVFLLTQGTNYDTATVNDPFLVFKKYLQFKRAQNTILSGIDTKTKEIISAAESILKTSFIGKLQDAYTDIRNAFSEVLLSDKPSVRAVLEKVLEPYVFENDRDFIKISQKAVTDLFDWAVQIDRGLNSMVAKILLGTSTSESAAKEIIKFRNEVILDKSHPLYDNLIINGLRMKAGQREGVPDNVYLVNKDGKAYNQNQLIYAFSELKEKLGDQNKDLYGKLVRLAVIQSGLSNSPISFTSLLPYEDFKEIYNQSLFKLENMPNLQEFYKLGVFQRVNATNDDIVPSRKAVWRKSKKGKWFSRPNSPSEMSFINKKFKKAIGEGKIPQVINISPYSREAQSDYITFIWETGGYTKEQKAEMRKKADYSYLKKGLFRKVYTNQEKTTPLIDISESKDGNIYENFVYVMVNAWGDTFRGKEFYDIPRESSIDNGFVKVEDGEYTVDFVDDGARVSKPRKSSSEKSDEVITSYFPRPGAQQIQAAAQPAVTPQVTAPAQALVSGVGTENVLKMQPDNIAKIKAGTKTITNRTEYFKNGKYKLPDGTVVDLSFIGEYKYSPKTDSVQPTDPFGGAPAYDKNDFAKKEGFKDWADFEKNNKYSSNFINGTQSRYVYSIKPTQAVSGPSAETKINIYAGTGENAELSNFAIRPFKLGDDITYPTVEHAFQLEKLQYSKAYTYDQRLAIIKDMNSKSAAQVKAFGKTIKGLDVNDWNKYSSEIMKDLIKQSFQANPDALAKLLATGNATLTHTQDKGKWGTEFPRLLMEVREELRGTQFGSSEIDNILKQKEQESKNCNG